MTRRKSRARSLSVWTSGQRLGLSSLPARGDMKLAYDPQWMAAPAGRPLPFSLPCTLNDSPLKDARINNFFENLLPDNDVIRKQLATRFRTASMGAFDPLQAIGRDCVGAVQLLAEDEQPVGYDAVERTPLTDDDERVGNSKVNLSTSVENEWLCLNMLQAYGLPTASGKMLNFGCQQVPSVKRFDRPLHSSGKWLMGLPQEDFCEALGAAPHLKYKADGGPGIRSIATVLRNSFTSAEDLRTFIAVMSNWPVKDTGQDHWSGCKAKMAMALLGRTHHHLKDIQRRHFDGLGILCGPGKCGGAVINPIIGRTKGVIQEVSARVPQHFARQRGRHRIQRPTARCYQASSNARHMMTWLEVCAQIQALRRRLQGSSLRDARARLPSTRKNPHGV